MPKNIPSNGKIEHSRVEEMLESHRKEVSPWRIFKIMSEFVSGFEFLRHYKRAITIFGSARTKPDNKYYEEAEKLSYDLAKSGFVIITGGGPGIMEAANKGAHRAGGISAGIGIKLEHEQGINEYVTEAETFKYFFTRKTMLAYASQAYVFFPGGFGTLDELFELLTLVQTQKIDPIPIILVGKDYWEPLIDWIEKTLLEKYNTIYGKDMGIYSLVDSAEEANKLIQELVDQGKVQHGM